MKYILIISILLYSNICNAIYVVLDLLKFYECTSRTIKNLEILKIEEYKPIDNKHIYKIIDEDKSIIWTRSNYENSSCKLFTYIRDRNDIKRLCKLELQGSIINNKLYYENNRGIWFQLTSIEYERKLENLMNKLQYDINYIDNNITNIKTTEFGNSIININPKKSFIIFNTIKDNNNNIWFSPNPNSYCIEIVLYKRKNTKKALQLTIVNNNQPSFKHYILIRYNFWVETNIYEFIKHSNKIINECSLNIINRHNINTSMFSYNNKIENNVSIDTFIANHSSINTLVMHGDHILWNSPNNNIKCIYANSYLVNNQIKLAKLFIDGLIGNEIYFHHSHEGWIQVNNINFYRLLNELENVF